MIRRGSVKNLASRFEQPAPANEEFESSPTNLLLPVKPRSRSVFLPEVMNNSSTSSSPLSKEREEIKQLTRRGSIKVMQNKFASGEVSNISQQKTEIDQSMFSSVKVKEQSEEIEKREKKLLKLERFSVPNEKAIYVHPFSKENKFEIYQNSKLVKTCFAFIDTSDLNSGEFLCKPFTQLGLTREELPLTEFSFKVKVDGENVPDFHDLGVVDVDFEFKNKDKPIINEIALCTFTDSVRNQIMFECQTDLSGKIQQVLPPGDVKIQIASYDIEVHSKVALPTHVTNRQNAMKINTSLKTNSKNSALAGSSLIDEGDIVVLGDASGSMFSDNKAPFMTLISCLERFVNFAVERKQNISIAFWGSSIKWFRNGKFIKESDVSAFKSFAMEISKNYKWGLGETMLNQALESTFEKQPNISNILIMCDGEIDDVNSVASFKEIRRLYPNTNFHFTGIGYKSARNMEAMAQYGNGNYEFSEIKLY